MPKHDVRISPHPILTADKMEHGQIARIAGEHVHAGKVLMCYLFKGGRESERNWFLMEDPKLIYQLKEATTMPVQILLPGTEINVVVGK